MTSGVDLDLDSRIAEPLGDAFEFLLGDLLEVLGGCLAVDAVEHDFSGLDLEIGAEQSVELGVGGVVEMLSVILTPDHDGLDDALSREFLEVGDDALG